MSAGQSATNSEIYVDLNQVSADSHRSEVLSSALVEATDPVAADALIKDLGSDQQLNVNAMLESKYYNDQTVSALPIASLGILVSLIMAVGSAFAAMNTMYAAVAYRAREIATLRILGFSRASILISFVFESVLVSLLGAVCGILLMLPFNGMQTGTSNQVTFSEVVFALRMTPGVVMAAIVFGVVMGFLGGLFPAWHAARQEILTALRG